MTRDLVQRIKDNARDGALHVVRRDDEALKEELRRRKSEEGRNGEH
jgi:hypothetical protein